VSGQIRLSDEDFAAVVRYLLWRIGEGEEMPKDAFILLLHLAVRARSETVDSKVDMIARFLGGKPEGLHPKTVDSTIEWLKHERPDWLDRGQSPKDARRKTFSIAGLVRLARKHERGVRAWLDGLDD
jgi:hypothetical protein